MGYYTRHELTIVKGNDNSTDYEKEICEMVDYDDLFEGECKWYECEEDMKKYSEKHPNTLFCISGEGEESGDLWEKYFLNGKTQHCSAIITYEKFDETKLC